MNNIFLQPADLPPPKFGFNGLGELVYIRTYARKLPDGSLEKWHETVERVVNGTFNLQKRHMIKVRLIRFFNHLKQDKNQRNLCSTTSTGTRTLRKKKPWICLLESIP